MEDGAELPQMRVSANGRLLADPVAVTNNNWAYKSYLFQNIEFEAGAVNLSVEFINDLNNRGLWIDKILVRKTSALLPTDKRFVAEAETMTAQGGHYTASNSMLLWSDGTLSTSRQNMTSGIYEVEVVAFGVDDNGTLPQMRVRASTRAAGQPVTVKNSNWNFQSYVFSGIELDAGTHDFSVDYFNHTGAQGLWIDKIIVRKIADLPLQANRLVYEAEALSATGGNFSSGNGHLLWSDGVLNTSLLNLSAGKYDIEIDAFGVPNTAGLPQLRTKLDGASIRAGQTIANNNWNYTRYTVASVDITPNSHTLSFSLEPGTGDLWIDRIVVKKTGDLPLPSQTAVFSLQLDNALLQEAQNFGYITAVGSTLRGWITQLTKNFLTGFRDVFDYLVFVPTLAAAKHLSLATFGNSSDDDIGTFFVGAANDILGIGSSVEDARAEFGSSNSGEFEGMLYLDSGLLYDPDFRFSSSDFSQLRNNILWENILSQEMAHRYGSFLTGSADNPLSILGRQLAHWGVFYDANFSPMDGNDWTDNGNGTFTLTRSYIDEIGDKRSLQKMPYNDLDLYSMGLLAPSEVSAGFVIDNPRLQDGRRLRPYVDPSDDPRAFGPFVQVETSPGIWSVGVYLPSDWVISGQKRTITLQDILNLEGPRTPGLGGTSRNRSAAFVVLSDTSDSAATLAAMTQKVNAFQREFVPFYSEITRDLGSLNLAAGTPTGFVLAALDGKIG